MRPEGIRLTLAALAALLASACAQPDVYTEPYLSIAPASAGAPLPVTLVVTYSVDGKPDAKRQQALTAGLADTLNQGSAFKAADPATAAGELKVAVDDTSGTAKSSLLAGFGASVGHVLVSEPEFTPQGRRTVRELHVAISYTPTGGTALVQAYMSKLVTVTNNTQEPTDLVPLQDRKHAELALIGNDLNGFAAELQKHAGPAAP